MPKERRHFDSSREQYQHAASSSSRYHRHSSSRNSLGRQYHPAAAICNRYQWQTLSQDSPKFVSSAAKNVKPAACDIKKTIDIKSTAEDMKEWDEVHCPICVEHPHNAILLICTSHEKGCRPFMCNTSCRHSNCFDKFQELSHNESQRPKMLLCPLCRGQVTSWMVLQPARRYMNAKIRSCSRETCQFSGGYEELRKHAKREHPDVRPSEVDPERHHNWRRIEEQQDFGDLLSTMQQGIYDQEILFEFQLTDFYTDEEPESGYLGY